MTITTGGRLVYWDKEDHKTKSNARILMEQKLGRKLASSEFVHHIDGNPQNDAFENLEIIPGGHREHAIYRHVATLFGGIEGRQKGGEKLRKSTDNFLWCSSCQQLLLKENFHKNKSRWTGYQQDCKACKKKRRKKDQTASKIDTL